MKAIFKIPKGGSKAIHTVKYVLADKDKIGAVFKSSDLTGITTHRGISDRIERKTKLFCGQRKGRMRDHYIISAPHGVDRHAFTLAIPTMLKELSKELDIKTYLAVIHEDAGHPHVHVVCDAYAPSIGRGHRRHIDISHLKELNDMTWTKTFEAASPECNPGRSKRGQELHERAFKRTSVDKIKLAAEIYKRLGKVTSIEDMVDKLGKTDLRNIQTDFYTKTGAIKKRPSVTKSGIAMRLTWLQENIKLLKETDQFKSPKKEKKCGGCGKPRRQCTCGDR